MFIELHILQSFPPSNVNRDDLNQPKDGCFGGARRARISSQCLKRAIRTNPVFQQTTGVDNGFRSRYLTRALRKALGPINRPEDEIATITRAVAAAYTSKKNEMDSEDPDRTKVVVSLTPSDVGWVRQEMLAHWEELLVAPAETAPDGEEGQQEKKPRKKKAAPKNSALTELVGGLIKRTTHRADAPDIALFGRMLSDHPETNVDAACQVAYAFSTHEVRKMDDDFFSVVDDLAQPEETGAAIIGNTYFTSACFYRYSRLDWTQLNKNLQDDDLARRTVRAFLLASEAATPTGMANSHDNNSRPSFMLGVARAEKSPAWSLANAFEKPVVASGSGFVAPSIRALDTYWIGQTQFYGKDTVRAAAAAMHPSISPDILHEATRAVLKPTFAEWVEALMNSLPPKE